MERRQGEAARPGSTNEHSPRSQQRQTECGTKSRVYKGYKGILLSSAKVCIKK